MKMTFAKTIFYLSLILIIGSSIANLIIIQNRQVTVPTSVEVNTPNIQNSAFTQTPTTEESLNSSGWDLEINTDLKISFKHPPFWTQITSGVNAIGYSTKENSPRGFWVFRYDNKKNLDIQTWWDQNAFRPGYQLNPTQVAGKTAYIESPAEITATRQIQYFYVIFPDRVYQIRATTEVGNNTDIQTITLILNSLKFL